ncbi:DUF7096 domain-containing protein [Natronorubrum sp. FCH18a]|uniref:DUF7096 domain-containing protein n=1 Tax=Natronorubrum sp. FCH18a TaxID=3447018 RepID=UPI003F5170C6
MNSATPVVLAMLLVTSLLAMPVIAVGPEADDATRDAPDSQFQQLTLQQASSSPVEAEDTTNRLQLSGEIRDERTTYGTDLGLALASVDDHLRVDHEQYTIVDSEFDDATADERKNMVREADNRISERTEALAEREREAVQDHAAGDSTDTELIQTLLRNYHEAAVLWDALDELDNDRTDAIPGYGLSNKQVRADKAALDLHQTSLRASLDQASQSSGWDEQPDARIQTSENGYSLSMIEGDMYVLETVRFDNRNTSAENQFEEYSNSETMEAATEHYPWAGGEQSWSSFNDYGEQHLYFVEMEDDRNHLEVYLDGGTGEVYRESQELALDSLPEDDSESWINDGLELTLTETPVNGPVEVRVTDMVSGEPESATVSMNGEVLGETDDDGTLWLLPPLGEYHVTVETDSGSVDTETSNTRP